MKTIHGFTLQEIFDQAHLAKMGVAFEDFANAPMATLEINGQRDAVQIMQTGMRPLLPAQVQIRRTLEAEWVKQGQQIEMRPRRQNQRQNATHPKRTVLAA